MKLHSNYEIKISNYYIKRIQHSVMYAQLSVSFTYMTCGNELYCDKSINLIIQMLLYLFIAVCLVLPNSSLDQRTLSLLWLLGLLIPRTPHVACSELVYGPRIVQRKGRKVQFLINSTYWGWNRDLNKLDIVYHYSSAVLHLAIVQYSETWDTTPRIYAKSTAFLWSPCARSYTTLVYDSLAGRVLARTHARMYKSARTHTHIYIYIINKQYVFGDVMCSKPIYIYIGLLHITSPKTHCLLTCIMVRLLRNMFRNVDITAHDVFKYKISF